MSVLRRVLLRLHNVIRRGPAEEQLAREVGSHLALLEDRFRATGMTPEEARAAARRAFGGGVEQAKEIQRDARSFIWLDDVQRDVRYAVRTLVRTPGFTCVAVFTLALGIGAVTIIYSVINNVLFDPLPYPNSDRLVNVLVKDLATGRSRGSIGASEFLDFQQGADAFEDVIGAAGVGMLLSGPERSEFLRAVWVTPNFFDFMGLPPLMGRTAGSAERPARRNAGRGVEAPGLDQCIRRGSRDRRQDDRPERSAVHRRRRHASEVHVARGRRLDSQADRSRRPAGAGKPQLPGASQATRHHRAGGGPARAHRGAPRAGTSSRLPGEVSGRRRQRHRVHRRWVQPGALHHAGCRGAAAPDRVLQRRQHAAGKGHRARAGDDGPGGARRRPWADRAPVAGREPAARRERRSARLSVGVCRARRPRRAAAAITIAR